MKRIKICYVVTIPLTIRSFFIPQLKYLSEKGMDVTVICQPDETIEKELNNIHFIPVNIPRGINVTQMIKAFLELYRIFKKNQYDIIQYSTSNASIIASFAGVLANIRIRNYHMMGIRYLGFRGILRAIFKAIEWFTCVCSTSIECVSHSNLNLCIQEKLFKKGKGTVVWKGSTGGINLRRFDVDKRVQYRWLVRKELNISQDEFVFGFVGRITKDKGINEIIEAFNMLNQDARLLFIGDKEGIETLDVQLYRGALNNPKIIFHSSVNDIERYYSAIDVLLLPSYREGFGNVVIEAAAMGTPAIVSRIPGPIDASKKNKTALWVKKEDSKSLEKAMEYCLTNPDRLKKMQIECVNFVKENFDQNKLNKEILRRKQFLLEKRDHL